MKQQNGVEAPLQGLEGLPLEPVSDRRWRHFKQLVMVSAVCLGYVCMGSSQVWPSPALYDLSLHNETFFSTTLVLSSAEKDMTGSLLFFGILCGSLISGPVVHRYGRRRTLQLTALPFLAGWLVVGFSPSVPPLLFGRLGWVPLVCVGVALFGLEIGVQPIPFILAVEYFPTSLRTYSSSVGSISFTVSGFAMLQLYSPLQRLFTQAGLYWFFGASSLVNIAFTLFYVTETKKLAVG